MTPDTRSAIPSLDGIRAIAVSIVFFAHSGLDHWVPGGLGVTIFFVLSGYLITTLLREEHARTGDIRFRAFYLRRVLRLMPPMLVVVTLTGVLCAADLHGGGFSAAGLASVLLYFANYHFIAHDFAGVPDGIGVFWSLAVEEHYYLLYPPLALVLLRARRRETIAATLLLLCVGMLAWRCWLFAQGGTDLDRHLAMATDTRADAILVGCLMGLLVNPWLDRGTAVPRSGSRLCTRDRLVLVTCAGVLLASLLYREDTFRATVRYTLQSLAIAPLLWLAVARADAWPFRWLNVPGVAWLGRVSYSVYLVHQVVIAALESHAPQWGWLATLLVAIGLSLGFAALMHRFVETPCAALRRRLHRTRTGNPASRAVVAEAA